MDPILKAWMFYSWAEDYNDENKILENQGYLIGSFINPEAVKRALGAGDKTFASTDEEFDRFSKQLLEYNKEADKKLKKRKRKSKLKG